MAKEKELKPATNKVLAEFLNVTEGAVDQYPKKNACL